MRYDGLVALGLGEMFVFLALGVYYNSLALVYLSGIVMGATAFFVIVLAVARGRR